MVDNGISTLTTPVELATNRTKDMTAFPDNTAAASKGTDPDGNAYLATDKAGFILYKHDIIGGDGSSTTGVVNYVAANTTAYWYTVDASGTVTQYDTAP